MSLRDLGIAAGHGVPGHLIGLLGKKRSGKDTFARGLVAEGFTRYAFADPLKEAALALDPLIRLQPDEPLPVIHEPEWEGVRATRLQRLSQIVLEQGWEAAKQYREVRRTLQNYGVAIREIDEDFWLRATLGRAVANTPSVVTDVRFPNEAAAIRTAGGILVRIHRDGLDSSDQHVSETALDGYVVDEVIYNSGTADDLIAQAVEFASR